MEAILKENNNGSGYGLNGLFAFPKFAAAVFNGTDDILRRAVSNFGTGATSRYIKAYWNVISGTNLMFSSADEGTASKYVIFQVVNGQVIFLMYKDGAVLNRIRSTVNTYYGWHTFEVTATGTFGVDGKYVMKVDEEEVSFTVVNGSDDGAWFDQCTNPGRDNICIGSYKTNATTFGVGSGAWVEVNGTNKWILTGRGKYCYDIIGSLHLTYSGSGSKITYHRNGSNLLYKTGFSKFTKDGELDEYVPYTQAGEVQAPTELSTYTKQYDSSYNAKYYNLAPCVFDMNPAKLTESKLDIFNKANSTIHVATAEMLYYDANNTYDWREDELITFAIYNAYFNSDYQNRLFTKVENNLLKEILNCKAKQTGSALTKAKSYCGIV